MPEKHHKLCAHKETNNRKCCCRRSHQAHKTHHAHHAHQAHHAHKTHQAHHAHRGPQPVPDPTPGRAAHVNQRNIPVTARAQLF